MTRVETKHLPIPATTEAVAKAAIDAAFSVQKALGPGLLESVYEACLCHELASRGIRFAKQVSLPVVYNGVKVDAGLRLDVFVENCVILELKSVENHNRLFEAQVLTYLKLTGVRLGLLINFNVAVLKDGLRRIVH